MQKRLEQVPIRTSLIYWGLAALWILLSDETLELLINDPHTISKLQRYKGWVFVTVTSLLLFFSLRSQMRRLSRIANENIQSKKALQESENRLSAIIDSAMDAVITIDDHGKILFFNSMAEKVFRCSSEFVVGQSCKRFIPDRCYQAFERRLKKLSESKCSTDTIDDPELQIARRADGEEFPIESTISQVQVADQKLFTIFYRDIGDQLRAEAIRQEQKLIESRLTKLAAAAPGILCNFRLQPNGVVSMPYASAAIYQLYGLSPAEVAKDATPIFERINPEDLSHVHETIQKSVEEMSVWQDEFRINHPERGEIWVEGISMPEREPDGSILWHGFITDVTARKQVEAALKNLNDELEQQVLDRTKELRASEERMRLIGNHGTDGFWDWNLLTDDEYLSPGFKASIGYEDHELPNHASTWKKIILPEDFLKIRLAFSEHTLKNKPYELQVRFRHKNGALVWFLCRGVALKDEGGKFVRMVGTLINITRQKLAEEALYELNTELEHRVLERTQELHRSETSFRQLAESLPQLVWTADAQGHTDYYSQQWIDYTGMPAHRQFGDRWLNNIHSDDRERVRAVWEKAVKTGADYRVEFRIRRHDGKYRWFDTRAVSMKDESGQVVKWFGTNTDIQEQRQLREELRLSEEHLRLALEAAQIGTWERDLTSDNLFWSPKLEKLMGFAPGTFPGTYQAFLSLVHPDDLGMLAEAQEKSRIENGKYQVELRFNLPDGRVRSGYINGQIIYDEKNNPIKVVGIDWEITERKLAEAALRESEQKYRQLVEALPLAVYTTDASGYINLYNEAAVKLWGKRPVIGQTRWGGARNLRAPDGTPISLDQSPIVTALQENRSIRGVEMMQDSSDGESITFMAYPTPMYNSDGKLAGVVNALVDITERKQAERRLALQNAIGKALAEAPSLKDAAPQMIEAICQTEGWEFGAIWELREETQSLHCVDLWHRSTGNFIELERLTRELSFKKGFGLPGKIWENGAPIIIKEIRSNPKFARTPAALNANLHSTFGFPIFIGNKVVGVVDFLGKKIRSYDPELPNLFGAIGNQIGMFIDRKKAEQKMRESENNFRALIEATSQIVWQADANGISAEIPHWWTDLTGMTLAETRESGWIGAVHPDDREAVQLVWSQAFLHLKPFGLEYRIKNKQGDYRYFSVRGVPVFHPDNTLRQWIGTFNDITESKQHEIEISRLAAIVESSDDAIISKNFEGIITTWNHGAERIFGYRANEIIGQRITTIIPPDLQNEEIMIIDRLRRGDRITHYETTRMRKNGQKFPVSITVSPIIDKSGNVIGISKIAQDITQRKVAEEALARYTAELQRSNKDLEQFAYVASHDLQEPLRAVAGCVQILQRRFRHQLDADADELITHSVDGATRMQKLIDDLLEFSRVGTRGGKFQKVNAENILRDVIQNLSTAIEESEAQITHDSLPMIMADSTQMKQLLQNLIGNAIKFRGPEPPRIHLGIQQNDQFLVFSIRDNGIGIEPQYFDRIFGVFQRLHTRSEYPGTGIGLAICQKIVERHGGKIWVESQPRAGATFFFSLPVNQKAESQIHTEKVIYAN